MSTNIGTLTIEMAANVARLQKDMEEARRTVDRSMKSVAQAADLAKKALGFLGAGVSIAGLTGIIKSSADTADALSKLSQRTGVTVENLSKLQYAAKLNDATSQELGNAIKGLSNKMLDASKGTGDAANVFRALGVSITDASGKMRPVGSVLDDIADRFAGMEDGATKSAIANKLMEESGIKLIPMLNNGSAGLRAMGDEAERFGIVVSTDAANASVLFNDNLVRMQTLLDAAGQQMSMQVIPVVADLTSQFLATADGMSSAKSVGDGFAFFLKELAATGVGAATAFELAGTSIGGLAAAASLVASGEFAQAGRVIDEMVADLDRITDGAATRINAIRSAGESIATTGTQAKAASVDMQALMASLSAGGSAAKKAKDETEGYAKHLRDMLAKDMEAAAKAQEDLTRRYAEALGPLEEYALELESQLATYGMTEAQIAATTLARYEEVRALAAQNGASESYLAQLDREIHARRRIAEASAGIDVLKQNEEAKDSFEDLKQAIEGWGKDSAKAIVDFAMTGKTSFTEMVNSMIADMARMVVQQKITGPLAQAVSSFDWGGLASSFFGGSPASPAMVSRGGGFSPSMHSGGIVGSGEGSGMRFVPPAVFDGAPRYHFGGIAGDEVPTILQRGEGVFTRGQMAALGQMAAPSVNVEIINNTGAQVQQSEVADSRGGRKMQIVIGDAVAGEMRRPGSSINSATRQTFGLSPVLAGR